jgi:hypothetical protein
MDLNHVPWSATNPSTANPPHTMMRDLPLSAMLVNHGT